MKAANADYTIDAKTGLALDARMVASPNFDQRSIPDAIDTIIVHSISLPPGAFGGEAIEQLFTNTLDFDAHPYYRKIRGLEVSSHFLIRRTGEVVQFVSADDRAWHAGESFFYGKSSVNDFSIGIELEGVDDGVFEPTQYASLIDLGASLLRRYSGIGIERICGHSDIAPGRKTDPGPGFDWGKFRRGLCRYL